MPNILETSNSRRRTRSERDSAISVVSTERSPSLGSTELVMPQTQRTDEGSSSQAISPRSAWSAMREPFTHTPSPSERGLIRRSGMISPESTGTSGSDSIAASPLNTPVGRRRRTTSRSRVSETLITRKRSCADAFLSDDAQHQSKRVCR